MGALHFPIIVMMGPSLMVGPKSPVVHTRSLTSWNIG